MLTAEITTEVTTEPVATQLCSECLLTLPLDFFRRRKAGEETRDRRCDECHRQAQRRFRERRRAKGIGKLVTQLASDKTDDKRLIRLTTIAVQKYGGPERLGQSLAEQLKLAMAEGARTRAARLLLALIKMIRVSDERRRALAAERFQRRDFNGMDEAELQEHLLEILTDAVGAGGAAG